MTDATGPLCVEYSPETTLAATDMRIRACVLFAALAGAALPIAVPQSAATDGTAAGAGAARAAEDGPAKDPDPSDEAPRTASDYPRGASLVTPEGDAVRAPLGMAENGSRIRIRVDPRRSSPPPPRPRFDPASLDRATVPPLAPDGAAERTEAGTIGPTPSEQLDVFDEPRAVTGRQVRDASAWTPTAAYEELVPGQAYPWQPAKWGRAAIDPTWTPDPAWPRRDEDDVAYPWNPVRWSTTGIGSTWRPTNSWSRGGGGK